MRVFALGASFMAMSGCSLFWSLDRLEGGTCGDGCVDGASYTYDGTADEPPASDGSGDEASPGGDSSPPHDGEVLGDAADVGEASCTPPTPPSLDDCTGLLPLPAAPVIDGVLDCGIPLWPMPLAGWTGPGVLPPSVRATLAIGWRSDGLYFFVHVTGVGPTRYPPPPGSSGQWCGDAVELFVDDDGHYANPPSYDNPGTIQVIAESPTNAMTTATVGEMFRDGNDVGPWKGQFVVVRTSDGFDGEAFVRAADLGLSSWSLTQGAMAGLNVAVDLGDPNNQAATCPRLGQFSIQLPVTDASCDRAACNTYDFCSPRLDP